MLQLDRLVVPLLAGHHPPGKEESENDHGYPDNHGQVEHSHVNGHGENDDNKGVQERVSDQAPHSNDDSSPVFSVVLPHHVLDHEEVEDNLGKVDEDRDDFGSDTYVKSNELDHVVDVDQTVGSEGIDTAHNWETAAALHISLLVGSG